MESFGENSSWELADQRNCWLLLPPIVSPGRFFFTKRSSLGVSLRLLLSDRPRFVMCIRWWTLVNISFVGTAMSFEQTNLLHLFTCWLLVYIWFLHVLWCEKMCGLKLNGAWGSCAGSKDHTSSVLEVREEAGLEAVNIYALTGDHHCKFW
jgi:hypothetical protein